jgi:hypothetical protein
MEWNGQLQKPSKYSNSTFNGTKIGFVQLVKNAQYDEDGYIIESSSVTLYDADENMMKSYIRLSYDVDPFSQADYILCAIQGEKGVDVCK